MAVNLFEGFSNDITGEHFRCLACNKEAATFDWIVQPDGYVPFEHIHLCQDEVFHVKSGELQLEIDGKELIARPGDTVVVPRGKKHIARNNSAETLQCVLEYTPGLDTYRFFQCFAGLTKDKYLDKKGQVSIPMMLYFTRKMKAQCVARPSSIPAPLFTLAMNFFFLAGGLLGWSKLYWKYTGARGKLIPPSALVQRPQHRYHNSPH